MSVINESLKSINNELIWSWNENELIVPQCEDTEDKQLEESTIGLDWQASHFYENAFLFSNVINNFLIYKIF